MCKTAACLCHIFSPPAATKEFIWQAGTMSQTESIENGGQG
jgi:hypothetical protein